VVSTRKPQGIFINCPFDAEYRPVFEALVFAVIECGFRPRSALELVDGAEVRFDKICRIIGSCRLAIHDISRTELDAVNHLPRFNMPFELGLFLGASRFGQGAQRSKRCLILDREPYRYQKFISDISGQDISAHHDRPEHAIRAVRDWLSTMSSERQFAGASHIFGRYQQFSSDVPKLAKELRLRHDEATFVDLCNLIATWLVRLG
jgi:hypothetical protein